MSPCSRGTLWKINKHDQWSLISFYSLSFIVIFNFSFAIFFLYIFLCYLTELFLFFAGTFGYFHPWSWLQNFSVGGNHLILLQIREVFSLIALFCFLLFIYFIFICIIVFSSSLSLGVKSIKMTKLKIFCTFNYERVSCVSMLLLFVFLISFVFF